MHALVRIAGFMAIATLTVGAIVFVPAFAGVDNGVPAIAPKQMFAQPLGSKQAVGYFEEVDGRCAITLMVAEAFDRVNGRLPFSSTKITMTIDPDQSTSVESAEAKRLTVVCGPNARSVSVESSQGPEL